MKKSIFKLLILLTITSLILLFFIGCKSPDSTEFEERIKALEEELAKKESEETSPEEAPPEIITDTEQMEEEEAEAEESDDEDVDTDSDTDVDKEAPTISLAIYEGPTLDGSICYYRIEATVTGSPTISFSKDDSGGAWGSKKVQININNPGDTYNLTATATNSEGSVTDSITLSWGCAVPAPDPIVKNVDKGVDASLSGYIIVTQGIYINSQINVGDSTNNLPVNAYLSFDIEDPGDIDGITIKDVSMIIPIALIKNNPELVPGFKVIIGVCDYGNSLDYPADQTNPDYIGVKTLDATNPLADFNFSTNTLKNELQKAVDVDKKWFQIKIGLFDTSANDTPDYYRINKSDIILHIEYEIPG